MLFHFTQSIIEAGRFKRLRDRPVREMACGAVIHPVCVAMCLNRDVLVLLDVQEASSSHVYEVNSASSLSIDDDVVGQSV